jgi:hypothetical protein
MQLSTVGQQGSRRGHTSFPSSNFDLTEQTVGDFARTVIWKGSSEKKTAVGRDVKKISSKRRVKSKARQEESTLGPNIRLLVGKHVDDIIVS